MAGIALEKPEREPARAHLNNALCMIGLALDVELAPEMFQDFESYQHTVQLLAGVRDRINAALERIKELLERTAPYSHTNWRPTHYL